jgi:membrane protease YdiL (CAAX protease family)
MGDSAATTLPEEAGVESVPIAPAWHTAVVLLLFAAMATGAVLGGHRAAGQIRHRILGYAISMAIEWLIFGFIAIGPLWQGPSIKALAGRFPPTLRSVTLDLGIAVAYLLVANYLLAGLQTVLGHFMKSGVAESLRNALPHTILEDAVFLLVALTAAICEETIFRGYLQQQFTGWTRNAAAGIVLQAIAFGAAHAYQGTTGIIAVASFGCMFGCLAWWRKSLRPGILAHFFQDAIGGLVLARFVK